MRFGKILALMLIFFGKIFAVYYGETKDELLTELGRPTSVLMKGGREILLYPKGGRIELQDGKVVSVQGIEVREGPGAENVAGNEIAPAAVPAPGESPPLESAGSAAAKVDPEAALQAQMAADRARMEKAIDDLENPPPVETAFANTAFNAMAFVTGLAVKWLMMVAALKLTCKYWSVEIAWPGILIAALADTGVRAVILLAVEELMGMPSAFYADEAVGAIVLVMVLKKVSFNQSTAQAVQITMTSKVFSIVVGSFLTVVILRALN